MRLQPNNVCQASWHTFEIVIVTHLPVWYPTKLSAAGRPAHHAGDQGRTDTFSALSMLSKLIYFSSLGRTQPLTITFTNRSLTRSLRSSRSKTGHGTVAT